MKILKKIKDVINLDRFNNDGYYLFQLESVVTPNGTSNQCILSQEFRRYLNTIESEHSYGLDKVDLIAKWLFDMNNDAVAESYYLEHSFDKNISPYYERMLERYDVEPTSNDNAEYDKYIRMLRRVAQNICSRYALNWYKLFDSYFKDYNPLENYRMEEIRTPNLTEVTSGSDSITSTTKTKTDLTQTGSNDSQTGLFAFNSSGQNSVPTNNGTVDSSVRTTGNENDNYSSTTQGKTDSSSKTNTGTERLERSGNIGVTTSQQMLQSELELRKFDLLNRIFDDIDKVLCLKIY